MRKTRDDIRQEKVNEKKKELLKKAHIFKRLFTTDEGQKVLKYLEEYAEPDVMFDPNPTTCAYNCARRDFLKHIKDLMEYGDENL